MRPFEHTIETALGTIKTFVRINGRIVESRILDEADVMFSIGKYEPDSHHHDEFLANQSYAVFQCSTKNKIRQISFECRWENASRAMPARPESEKGINALRWSQEGHSVLIWTEDSKSLKDRMRKGQHISKGLKHCLDILTPELDHLIIEHKDDGFVVRLTEIPANEKFQLYFLMAWGKQLGTDSTWTQMDQLRTDATNAMDKSWSNGDRTTELLDE